VLTCACVAVHKFAPNRAIFRFFYKRVRISEKANLGLVWKAILIYCFKSMDASSSVKHGSEQTSPFDPTSQAGLRRELCCWDSRNLPW